MSAQPLSLICPDQVIDPLSLTAEMEHVGEDAARRYALLHNDLVELAGDVAGRRSDVVRRFAVKHGAGPDAAERYVAQWKLCRAARKAFGERIGLDDVVIDKSALCARADDFRATLQAADAQGMTAVLDYLLGIIAAAHGFTDPLKLMAELEEPDDLDSDSFALSVLTSLIATGRLSYEAAKATRLLQEALDCLGQSRPSDASESAYCDPADDAIAPEEVFADPIVTAPVVTTILNRLGKRHKRMFAWMHNRLVAVIRRYFGKRPADVRAALSRTKDDPALAARVERQWRETLALRDALDPMARVMHPTLDEAVRYAADFAPLYDKDENEPLHRLLRQLLCLATIATGDTAPIELELALQSGDEADPEGDVEQAVHCAMVLTGSFESDAPWEGEEPEEEDKLSEEQAKSLLAQADKLRDTFLIHLPRPHLAFFVLSLQGLLSLLHWFDAHETVVKRVLEKPGLPDGAEKVLSCVTGTMLALLASVAEEAQRLGEEKVELPHPAPGESELDCIQSTANAIWDKSIEMFGSKGNPLSMYVFLLNIPMYLLGEITQKEREAIRRSVESPLFELFPACMAFWACFCERMKDWLLKEASKAQAQGEAAASAPTQGFAVSPDFFKNDIMSMHHN